MAERALTNFEQVLLGMIASRPRSGYDLKHLFSGTPAAVYQPSPGALYPALRRLQQRGLLMVEAEESAGRRARRVWQPTEAGMAEHLAWLREPVDPATVSRDLGLHLMRFSLMEQHLPPSAAIAFLTSLGDALAGFVGGMTAFVAGDGAALPGRHPRLALEHGIAVHQASLDWARSAAARLAGEPSEVTA